MKFLIKFSKRFSINMDEIVSFTFEIKKKSLEFNVPIQVVCIIYTCVLYFLRRRWWEGPWWGGISSTEQTARSGSPQLFYTESRTGKIPMSTKTNVINIIMKKTQKLPCFGYNMLCKGSTHWIEDNDLHSTGTFVKCLWKKWKLGIFQKRLFLNIVGDIHFAGWRERSTETGEGR